MGTHTSTRLYHPYITLLLSLLLLVLLYLLFNPFSSISQLERLRYVGESAGRMMDRHLLFYAGYEQVGPLEQGLHRFLFGSREAVEQESIDTLREVLAFFTHHPQQTTPWALLNTRSRLLVVLAETGRTQELQAALAAFDDSPEAELVAEAIGYAYLQQGGDEELPQIMYGARLLPLGWAADRLWIRIAQRRGDQLAERYSLQRHLSEGAYQREQVRHLSLLVFTLVLGGFVLLWRQREWLATTRWIATAHHWPVEEAYALAVRAVVAGLLIVVLLQLWATQFFRPGLLAAWSTLFASLPMLYLIQRRLLAPRGMGLRAAFGLGLAGVGWRRLGVICLVFLAIDWLGGMAIGALAWSLDTSSHWAEAVDERLLFGPSSTLWLSMINLVVFTAIFEELGFRGLIYNTLRNRLSARWAIPLSALLFSALHLYSLAGFLSVFWSGLVLAYVYERYRSLLPGIVIHAAGNLFSYGTVLLFYT